MNVTDGELEVGTPPKRWLRSHSIGIVLFLILQSIPHFVPSLQIKLFSEPAARAAAIFLGTPLSIEPDAITLAHRSIEVAVTEACSGFDFFCLLTSLLIGLTFFKSEPKMALKRACLIPAVVYVLTLLGNTSRIVSAVQFRSATFGNIPASFDGIIHQSIGVAVFVTVLVLSWNFLTNYYDRQQST
tara:strand:+ start:1760 stop:2317 length:558 start_codon:yes stop_codon:yes gene_type:complete